MDSGELLFNEGRVSVWNDDTVLRLDGVMVAQHCKRI